MNHLQKQSDRRGTACVEAAVILPLLLLLAFGFIEIGYYVNCHHVLQDATRQGARAVVSLDNSNSEVRGAVVDSLNHSMDISSSAVTVQLAKLNSAGAVEYQISNLDDNEEGAAVRVTVSLAYSNFNPLSNYLGLAGGTLTSTAVMQRQK